MQSTGTARLVVPDRVPPSLNRVGGRAAPRAFHRFKKLWQELFAEQLLLATGRGEIERRVDYVCASAILTFTADRRRDEGNFRVIIEKALGDALTGDMRAWPDGRWLPDDTSAHYRFDRVEFARPRSRPATVVELEWSKGRLL